MPKPLDRAELGAATFNVTDRLRASGGLTPNCVAAAHAIILAALTDIAKRAFEQAARPEYGGSVLYVGRFPSQPLTDACAALDAPASDTPKQRTVPLTDAEVLKKLPAFITTASGEKMTDQELNALIEKIRWA